MEMTDAKIEYGFQEIYLLHNKCVAESRDQCNPSVVFGGRTFKNGVIAANMRSVVDIRTCKFLADNGMFYVMHRFDVDNCDFVKAMHDAGCFASISIGVNGDSEEQLIKMKRDSLIPEYITIDIANAYSVKAEKTIKKVKDLFPDCFLIVGNCATEEAVSKIEAWGADSVKCGISGGSVCTTYYATGFARPQFSTILECCKFANKPVIADGSIKYIGDISKAFVAGAEMVMAGSLFAGYDESAGEIIEIEGKRYKQFFGSASYNNTRTKKNTEGTCILVPYKGQMQKLLWDIDDGLRSAISYSGGLDIHAFKNVKWGVRSGGVRQ
jgi:GMP reductase